MSLEERIQELEKNLKQSLVKQVIPTCVFCWKYGDSQTGQTNHLTYRFNSLFFADDLVKQAIYSDTETYCCNHEKYSQNSLDVSHYISYAIDNNNANIDPYNPFEFISLVSDFKKMDYVLEYYKNFETCKINQILDETQNDGKISREELESLWKKYYQDNENKDELDYQTTRLLEDLDKLKNLDCTCNTSKKFIRKAGRKWIMSLDPDKYDIGYLYMVDKYGKGFDLSKLYRESKYQDVQKKKLEGLGIGFPFN